MAPPPDSHAKHLLLQFAREPVLGEVKTRMQPYLTAEQSLELHQFLVRQVFTTVHQSGLAAVEVWVAGDSGNHFFDEFRKVGVEVHQQWGGDLGSRMNDAISIGLSYAEKVVLVGSDCVALSADYLGQAYAALDHSEVVFGPAEDGGYVLVGMNKSISGVFSDIDWGTAAVMQQSREYCLKLGVVWKELDVLFDIDRPEDLTQLQLFTAGRQFMAELKTSR